MAEKEVLICPTCKKEIVGNAIRALGNAYHPDHFVCFKCKKKIESKFQVDEQNNPHCEACTEKFLVKKTLCAACNKPIEGKGFKVGEKFYHPECFKCSKCKKIIKDKYNVIDDHPFCEECYISVVSGNCFVCKKLVKDDIIKAGGHVFHEKCFICSLCKKKLTENPFTEHEGKMLCETCFMNNFAPKCKGCKKGIKDGPVIEALGGSWHVDCFKCSKCGTKINDDFVIENDKPVCKKCSGAASTSKK